jgi:hypothetical protein
VREPARDFRNIGIVLPGASSEAASNLDAGSDVPAASGKNAGLDSGTSRCSR